MKLKNIRSIEHPMYSKALRLYKASFPFHEQREALSQERILSCQEYNFGLIYDEDVFVGLALYWETESFVYIEHLCILPEMRNRQYGQRLLAAMTEKKKTIILEVDPPVDEISRRRKSFYERCGFVENHFPHIHPPYHRRNKGHELVIMSCPEGLSQKDYDSFSFYLRETVMDSVFD